MRLERVASLLEVRQCSSFLIATVGWGYLPWMARRGKERGKSNETKLLITKCNGRTDNEDVMS